MKITTNQEETQTQINGGPVVPGAARYNGLFLVPTRAAAGKRRRAGRRARRNRLQLVVTSKPPTRRG